MRVCLLRLTYALLILLSRVLTNGSNKAFAVAHTDSGFMPSSSVLVVRAGAGTEAPDVAATEEEEDDDDDDDDDDCPGINIVL